MHLTYFVTRRCHLRCPLCFYREARDAPGGAPELTADEIRRVARSTGRLMWVAFSGGEPFLREDLPEISQIFHDACRPAFLTYPTNGMQPEEVAASTAEILARCPGSAVILKLSIDGVGALHDAVRRAPGSFERLMRTYRLLLGLASRHPRLELGFNTLFCAENQWRMGEIVEFVHGLEGARSHTITMLRGGAGEDGARGVDLGQYRWATGQLERRWGRGHDRLHRFGGARLKAAQDRLQWRLIHRTLAEGRRVLACQAARLSLVLSESGDLHACEERPDRSLGNVRAAGYDVRAMLRSRRAEGLRREIAAGQCACTHECNLVTNILFNPRAYPALLREYGRLVLRPPGDGSVPAGPARPRGAAAGVAATGK